MAKKKPTPKVPSWRSRLIKDDDARRKKIADKKAAEKAREAAWKKSLLKVKTGVTRFIDSHVRGQQGPQAPTVKSHTRNMIEQSRSRTKAIQKRTAQKAEWAKADQPGPKHWSSPKAPQLPTPAAAAKLLADKKKAKADKKKATAKKPVRAKKVAVKAPPKPTPSRQPVRKAVSSSSGIKSKDVSDYGSKKKNLDAWSRANPQLAKDLAKRQEEKKKRVAHNIATGFKSSASKKSSIPTTKTASKKPDKTNLYSGGTGRNRNRIA